MSQPSILLCRLVVTWQFLTLKNYLPKLVTRVRKAKPEHQSNETIEIIIGFPLDRLNSI